MHGFVLLSVLLMSVEGVQLTWNLGVAYAFGLVVAILLSVYFIGAGPAFGYVISSAIQEICLLLAAMLITPAIGIIPNAIATSFVFTFAHKAHPAETGGRWWKYPLIFLYGIVSIALYVWLHQPLLNIASHIVAGVVLIYAGVLYPNYKTALERIN